MNEDGVKQHQGDFHAIAACFTVNDILKSAGYYREVLGFEFDRIWGDPPCFVVVKRGDIEIMLKCSEQAGPLRTEAAPGGQSWWNAYIRVNNLDALCDEFRSHGAKITRGPEDSGYGMREFELEDLNGYILCFSQDIGAE